MSNRHWLGRGFVTSVVCGCLASTGLVSATATAASDHAGTIAQQTDSPIRVGVNIGQASVPGQAYLNALELRVGMINGSGGVLGRPLELVVRDNQGDQTAAVTITNQLAEDGVVAMIGPDSSPATLAAMDSILAAGFPTFSLGSADSIVEPVEDRKNVFKPAQDGSLMAEALAKEMSEAGVNSVGLITVNSPYGENVEQSWRDLDAAGTIDLVAVEKFEPTDTNMTTQLTNLLDASPDAIMVGALPPAAPTIRRDAVESLGIDVPMYFDAGAGAELFIELAGSAADGSLIIHPRSLVWDQIGADEPQYDALQQFGIAYTEEYGSMSGFAGYAWDALGLLAAAMEKAGITDSDAINAALEDLGAYVGVVGTYEITPTNHQGLSLDDLVLIEVVDGQWVLADGAGG